MKTLTVADVLQIQEDILTRPFTSFGDEDLFPTLEEKVAALVHSG